MKTVKITEILAYYDGILAFTAQDPIGGHYVGSIIGSIIERTSENDRYLIVGARPERLDDLRNGKVDLRALLLEAPDGEWYVTVPEGTIDDPITLVPQHTRLADSVHLPGAGYFLGPEAPPDEAEIQRRLQRGKVVAVTGQVVQVNRDAGEWSLLTDHGPKAGRTSPSGPGLNGLQIGKRYRFKCAEVTEPDTLWRDQKTLYLQSIETA